MDPDAGTGALFAQVPGVRVVDRERTLTVQIRQFRAIDVAGHVVNTYRCLLVAPFLLAVALQADGDEIIRLELQVACVIAVNVNSRALLVDQDDIGLILGEKKNVFRVQVLVRLAAIVLPALLNFVSEILYRTIDLDSGTDFGKWFCLASNRSAYSMCPRRLCGYCLIRSRVLSRAWS